MSYVVSENGKPATVDGMPGYSDNEFETAEEAVEYAEDWLCTHEVVSHNEETGVMTFGDGQELLITSTE